MRKWLAVLTALLVIAAGSASSGASAQVPVRPPVVHLPVLQDSAIARSLRHAQEVLANAQRLIEDTSTIAAANRALENAAVLSAHVRDHLDAQQAVLEQRLQGSDAQLRRVFQQLEQVHRRLDEMIRQPPN
jgi:hypothetical protein